MTQNTNSIIGAKFLPPLDTEDSWPFADIVVMWNMILDGFAMIPQMHLIANSSDKASSGKGGDDARHSQSRGTSSRTAPIPLANWVGTYSTYQYRDPTVRSQR